ncbi:MAG: hypothetical protein ACTSQI_08035, partial [Candidatus Helarchaeota archaeon]
MKLKPKQLKSFILSGNTFVAFCIILFIITLVTIMTLPPTDIYSLSETDFGPFQFVPPYFWLSFCTLSVFSLILLLNKFIQFPSITHERLCYLLLGFSFGLLAIGSLVILFPYSTLSDSWHNTAFSEALIEDGVIHSSYVMSYPIFYIFNGILLQIPGLTPELLIQISPIICLTLYLIGSFLLVRNALNLFFPDLKESQKNKAWFLTFYFFCVFGAKLGIRINPAPQTLGYIFLLFFLTFFLKQVNKPTNKTRILPILLLNLILFTHIIVFSYLIFFLILMFFIRKFRREALITLLSVLPVIIIWFFTIFLNFIFPDPSIQIYYGYFLDILHFIADNFIIFIGAGLSVVIIIFLFIFRKKIFHENTDSSNFPLICIFFLSTSIFSIFNLNLYLITQILIYFFLIIMIVYSVLFNYAKRNLVLRDFSIIWIISLSLFLIPWVTYFFLGASLEFFERIFLYLIIPCGIITSLSFITMHTSKLQYIFLFLIFILGFFSQLSIQHNPLYAVDADVVKGYKTLELHLNEADNYFITSL